MKTWFKFYGQEFLTDPKMLSLTAIERSLWMTMLCLASSSDEEGVIKYLDEQKIMQMTNISPLDDEWTENDDFLKKFEELEMVTLEKNKIILNNFAKRQETNLSNAERQAKFRHKTEESNEKVTEKVTQPRYESNTRIEKNRIEKRRIDREIKPVSSLSYLLEIPKTDLEEFIKNLSCNESMVKSKAEDLYNYCKAKGKVYKDYKSFLLNALKKDFGKRQQVQVQDVPEEMSQEVRDRNRQRLAEMKISIKGMGHKLTDQEQSARQNDLMKQAEMLS